MPLSICTEHQCLCGFKNRSNQRGVVARTVAKGTESESHAESVTWPCFGFDLFVKLALDAMAIPPSRKPTRTELDFQLSFKRLDTFSVVVRDLIKWGGLAFLGYCGYLVVATLAGKTTLADIGIRFLANVKVSDGIILLLIGGGWAYGLGQRQLRRRHIERIVKSKNELEMLLDSKRTSSELTEKGTTRPGDDL